MGVDQHLPQSACGNPYFTGYDGRLILKDYRECLQV